MAFGTRRSRPHTASQSKRAAQTACSRAMQARGLQSTGGGRAAEARRTSWTTTAGLGKLLPTKASMACVQEGREVKVSTVRWAAGALHEAKCTRRTQGARLKNRVRVFTGGGPHLTSGPHARRQPRILHTATSRACPRRPLRGPPSFSHRKKGCCYGTPPSSAQAHLADAGGSP